ncbi:MAG: DUF4340 domain-containing protein [Ruminococcaceae bacterium]|nr:DUF4340 domain-containing protein [Oscillospiraceae bacterium]
MKKLLRLLIAEIVIVVVLLAALVGLILNPPGSEVESYVFADRSATEIAAIHVEHEAGAIDIKSQNGGFMIDGVPSELVDIETFIEFLSACSEVSALQKVDANKKDLAEFGLAPCQAWVYVTYTDGLELSLQLGSQERVSGNYYFSVDGQEGIYLMSGETAEYYLMVKESLISFYVTPELKVSSPLSAVGDVTFSGGPLEESVTIESVSFGDEEVRKLARSFGAATHIVRGNGVYELDQSYGLEMLTPLCGMTGDSIVYYGLTPEQENAMGFAEPYMQVEFDYKNGTGESALYVLRFLPAIEDGSYFYVNAAGSGLVFLIERPAFMDIVYEKLLLRWFVSPLLMDVSGITVESGDKVYDFTIDGSDVKNPIAALNGETVDISLFRSLFQLLNSAAADGDYLGVQTQPNEKPLMTVTYHYTEGKSDDVIALYSGSTRRVNVYVNGVCEFGMKDAFVERVKQALTAIEAGESFDINW